MITRRMLIAIGATVVCLVMAASAAATYPGANGLIAFQGAQGNQLSHQVWINTIRPDGTGIKPLAPGFSPSWSADGRHLLFERWVGSTSVGAPKSAIFTMHADGSDLRRIAYSPFIEGGATYTPGGHRILFTRTTQLVNVYDEFAIATMRVNGSDERIVARGDQLYPFEYSPTGGRILYSEDCQMWDMRPNGSHKRQLTNSGTCPNQQGDYSPDGKHISFWHQDRPYVMRSDGSHAHPLGCGPGAGFAVYSPDGRKLAWDQHIGPPRSAVGDIFTGTVRCTNPFRVTFQANLGGAFNPSWQPLP
jgi:hypothetical protein